MPAQQGRDFAHHLQWDGYPTVAQVPFPNTRPAQEAVTVIRATCPNEPMLTACDCTRNFSVKAPPWRYTATRSSLAFTIGDDCSASGAIGVTVGATTAVELACSIP